MFINQLIKCLVTTINQRKTKECRIEVKVRLQTAMLQGMLLVTFPPGLCPSRHSTCKHGKSEILTGREGGGPREREREGERQRNEDTDRHSVAGELCKLARVTGPEFPPPLLSSRTLPASDWPVPRGAV